MAPGSTASTLSIPDRTHSSSGQFLALSTGLLFPCFSEPVQIARSAVYSTVIGATSNGSSGTTRIHQGNGDLVGTVDPGIFATLVAVSPNGDYAVNNNRLIGRAGNQLATLGINRVTFLFSGEVFPGGLCVRA